MNLQILLLLMQISLTIALISCGSANEDRYYDRKIYVYTEDPTSSSRQSADATATNPAQKNSKNSPSGTATPVEGVSPSPQPNPQLESKGLIGAVDTISATGKLTGWAAVEADPSIVVMISISIDGNLLPETIAANLDSFDNNTPGAHAFAFEIAAALHDDREHTLQITAKHKDLSLEFPAQKFKIAPPAQNGQNFFLTNLQQNLQNRCGGCHPVNYQQQFASLSLPLPANGGTAINNELINMASGRNGNTNHPGGNICGNKNSGVCAQMQQWWSAEFGQN